NTIWFKDADSDGFYPDGGSSVSCSDPFPENSTYSAIPGGDCDDNNPALNPNTIWFKDADSDGFYPDGGSSVSCSDPFPENSTYSAIPGGDCDDNNPDLNPNTIWFKDADSDGFYPDDESAVSCENPFAPDNATYVAIPGGDCDDTDPQINPGASELCNGIDDNCNGIEEEELAVCGIPTCPTTIVAVPFHRTEMGDISISLFWNDPATNESGFVIEKSKSPDFSPSVSFVIYATDTTSYTLDFQEPLTLFYFRVYAFNPTGSCTPIATTSTYTPPGLLWAAFLIGDPQDANGFVVNPKMFDINGDGKKEIIIADNQGYVYAISTAEYNLQITPIPLWISRPGGNVEISTPAIAVYQGNPTVIVSDQGNNQIHILDKDGNLVRTIPLTQTPYPPIITDFNGDNLPDILVSIGAGGLVAYSFSGDQIFSVDIPGATFFFPSIFEYKGSSTYIVVGTNQKTIKGFSGNTEILNVDLRNLPFTNSNPFSFISTFKIGNLSHAVFGTQDGFLHIIRLVKNPIIKFDTNQNVVAKPLFYDFNNDGSPDIAINAGNTLFFIDGKTGNQNCQFNLGLTSYSSPALLTDIVSVVVGTDGGQIYAIKPDCTQRWVYSSAGFQIRSSPLVADIDKDGTIEIVVGAESTGEGKIIILKSDGTLEREIVSLKPIRSSPKMGDINGDGIYEVVIGTDTDEVSTTGGVFILNCPTDCASSHNLTSYTATGWGKVKTTPLLYDLDSDGFLDIVFADDSGKLYAMSGTSINYSQPYLLWSTNLTGVGQVVEEAIFPSSPTLFIKSGIPYIAIGSNGNGLYIVNGLNGSLEAQLFAPTPTTCFSSPATFDYNKDGVGDIVVGCDDKNIYFVSGTDYSAMRVEGTSGNVKGSPAIYDIDQDGFEDVVIGSDDNNLYVFNGVEIHLCSANLGINLDHQPAFYKNKIVVSSGLDLYVISATDCSQISGIFGFGIAPSSGASVGVYIQNNLLPGLVVGAAGIGVFLFDESFSYALPFVYTEEATPSSPVLGDIDGDGSLEFAI
ncbi:MAG: MopE-related protein, partial [Candidatus Calescibacterium sp.]